MSNSFRCPLAVVGILARHASEGSSVTPPGLTRWFNGLCTRSVSLRLLRTVLFVFILSINNRSVVSAADRTRQPTSSKAVVQANSVSDPIEVREFEVRVDDTPRGTHRLTIKQVDDNLHVDVQTDVKVDVIVYKYVFKFRGKEVWRHGRLLHSDIRCDDGGKKRSFLLKTDEGIQQVAYNDKPIKSSDLSVLTTAYWHLPHAELRDKQLTIADVDNGRIATASFAEVGPDKVTAGTKTITCRQFKVDGPSPAELWFDDNDRLVRQKSIEQGHSMELRLKQIRLEEPTSGGRKSPDSSNKPNATR